MNYLLDTHTFIWYSENDEQLPQHTKSLIKDPSNDIFFSMVSLWEIAIKVSLDKLDINRSLDEIIKEIEGSSLIWLPLLPKYIQKVSQLSFHHKDPFDRLIIAQGLVEQMTVITKDAVFEKYGVLTQW